MHTAAAVVFPVRASLLFLVQGTQHVCGEGGALHELASDQVTVVTGLHPVHVAAASAQFHRGCKTGGVLLGVVVVWVEPTVDDLFPKGDDVASSEF